MDIQITTLSENTANYGYLAEWGLSLLVEADGVTILVDTGFSTSAVHNAHVMGLDLKKIDKIVLSHGHDDHTGGLRELLKIRGQVEIIAHPDIWAPKYVRHPAGNSQYRYKYSGIPFLREELESLGARFTLTDQSVRITDNILTSGEIPMLSGYEHLEENQLVKNGDSYTLDPLNDDLALIINTDYGLVVVLGCAHHGIVNTLRHAQKLTGTELVYAAVGGTHLFRASEERMDRTVADLREMGVQRLGVSHCTGFKASARLAQEFGDIFFLNNAGFRFTLP